MRNKRGLFGVDVLIFVFGLAAIILLIYVIALPSKADIDSGEIWVLEMVDGKKHYFDSIYFHNSKSTVINGIKGEDKVVYPIVNVKCWYKESRK